MDLNSIGSVTIHISNPENYRFDINISSSIFYISPMHCPHPPEVHLNNIGSFILTSHPPVPIPPEVHLSGIGSCIAHFSDPIN